MRTFVISDAHGYPELIKSALEHGRFACGKDRLVYAGDFVDRGPDPQGCFDLIERYATEVLLGNHDLAALLDFVVWPQSPESRRFRPLLIDRVLNREPAREDASGQIGAAAKPGRGSAGWPGAAAMPAWKAVACVEGILVSHAGISERYEQVFREAGQGEPAFLADHLNEEFRQAVRRELATGESDRNGVLGDDGPLWFRPRPWSDLDPLGGVEQVAGHTPPVGRLAGTNFHMIDPCCWLRDFGEPGLFRYAVIEDGAVRVEQGD
jgi:hypothetical protein